MKRFINLLGLVLWLLVNVAFGILIVDFSLNVPFYDDFDAIGSFILNSDSSFLDRLLHVFDQYAEHRIGYTRMISLFYFSVFGDLNFKHLLGVGVCGLFILQGLLYWVIRHKPFRFWYMFVISLILLNFQYWENMMSAMTALQNISAPLFSLTALYFLTKGPFSSNRILTYFFICLAIVTSGNGMILLPIGFMYLIWIREEKQEIYRWILFSAGLIGLYFLNYHKPPEVFGGRSNMIDVLSNPMALFQNMTLFLTSTLRGLGWSLYVCFVLGGLMLTYVVWYIYRLISLDIPSNFNQRWYLLVLVFLLGTAFLVSINRGAGLENMLFSRYKIYSTLLLVLLFLILLESIYTRHIAILFTIFAFLFSYGSLQYVSTLYNHFNELKYASKTYYLNLRNWKGLYPPYTTDFTNAATASQISQQLDSAGYYQVSEKIQRTEMNILQQRVSTSNCTAFSTHVLPYHVELDMQTQPFAIDDFNCIEMRSGNQIVLLPLKINFSPKDILRKLIGRPVFSQSFYAIIPKSNVDRGSYSLTLILARQGVSQKCYLQNIQVPYLRTPQFHN
jgi:hypothetical protein